MEIIQARLYDAERQQEADEAALIRSWLKGLRRVMYQLEDLLEDITIPDIQDEQRALGIFTKTVCFLPSKWSFLRMNGRLFKEADGIMRELHRITSDMDRFHFSHDLMHDLAQMVGDECLLVDGPPKNVNNNIRHFQIDDVYCSSSQLQSWLTTIPHLRSYFQDCGYSVVAPNDIFSSLRRLRVLDLGNERFCSLPASIGKLKHLRYLRVRFEGYNLPRGITKLQHLQTLILNASNELRELPREFYKLTSLEILHIIENILNSVWLIDMPPRFGELISLRSLDRFIVGENDGLDALSRLNLA
ncbi:hypothetical protein Cgig2_017581 [Carnegiea gigantea]|uniref:Rx N-terminal domain-containing protein n=1 Tax=Carnegiea gigantea TaxID=171969 RepID=A0A9Q1KNJ9_9CARY|nr:hypothetical protein Cgig2_017581 [Carnegiea gigantea]